MNNEEDGEKGQGRDEESARARIVGVGPHCQIEFVQGALVGLFLRCFIGLFMGI